MASSISARHLSLLQPPSSFDQNFSDLSPLRRPRATRTESVSNPPRPFSLLYPSQAEDSSSPFSSLKRRSIIKTPSLASLNMGFGFKSEKSKEKEREKGKQPSRGNLKEKLQRPRTASETTRAFEPFTVRQRSSAESSLKALPISSTDPQPSTSQGRFNLQVPTMRGLKKKRSLASLLPAANESQSLLTPNEQAPSSTRSKSTNDTLSSPTTHDPDFDVDITLKPRPWTKRHKMKVRSNQTDAPYMQAYDPILLENDRYSDLLLRRLNPVDGPSFHNYESTPPSSVLDLGCGTGNWMLSAAAAWSQTKFTGFDLLDVLGEDMHMHDNISLLTGNFLEVPWPFENASFDLVRMANLALCIPHDKWDAVLLETQRVLRIDGRIELVDDEIFFPYASLTKSRPSSMSGLGSLRSEPTPPKYARGVSFLDSDTDDDTLGGNGSDDDYGTASSESTLTSERDFPFSLNGSSVSPSISRKHVHYRKRSSLRNSMDSQDLARTPTSPDYPITPTSTATVVPSPDGMELPSWSSQASASKDLETVFENMLRFKYGLYLRPSEVLPDAVHGVFGNIEELGTYQLKLAPPEAAKCPPSTGETTPEKDDKHVEPRTVGRKINDITKSWEEKWQMRKANKISNHELPPLDTQFLPTDTHIPEGLSAKAAGRLGITDDSPPSDYRVPDKFSTKAASRLGISVLGDLRRSDELVLSPVVENAGESESESDESLTNTPTPGNWTPTALADDGHDTISAKAAHRLGISYSALTQAAKASRRPLSSSSTLVSNSGVATTTQSSGLIVDSTSEFIPFSPAELEMHACKNMHMLLGCKPALLDFNAAFVDEKGRLLQSEEEFENALWDYECFRRRRFNWPSDDWDLDPPDLDDVTSPVVPSLKATSTPKTPTSHYRKSSDKFIPEVSVTLSSPLDGAVQPSLTPALNELTHVRTIHVYQAVKTSEQPFSKAAPPVFRPLPPVATTSPLIVSHVPSAPRIQVSNTL